MTRILAAALAFAALAPSAQAAEHTLLIYETKAELAERTDPARAQGYWTRFGAYAEAMTKAGVLRGGGAFAEPGPAGSDGRALSGYFIVDTPDAATAETWARQAPAGRVEVRGHLPMQAR